MSVLLFILLLLGGPFFCASWLKKTFEQSIALTCFSAIIFLYFAGLVNQLITGMFLLFGILILLWGLCFWKIVTLKTKKEFCRKIFTPGLGFYLVSIVFAYFIMRNKVFWHYDDFSHWGLITKEIWNCKSLCFFFPPEIQAKFTHIDYPPATAVWTFPFLWFAGNFNEGICLFALFALDLALFTGIFAFWRWRNLPSAVIWGIAIMLLPHYYLHSAYGTLMVDPVLGLLFGYAMAWPFMCDRQKSPFYYCFALSIFTASLFLIKQSGFIFALFIIIGNWITVIKNAMDNRKLCSLLKSYTTYIYLFVPFLFLISIRGLWQYKVAAHHLTGKFSNLSKISFHSIKELLCDNEPGYAQAVLNKYINAFYCADQVTHISPVFRFVNIPLIVLFFCLGVLFFLFNHFQSSDKLFRRERRTLYYYLYICLPVFCILLYFNYIFMFPPYEASYLAGLGRYIAAPFLGLCFCLSIAACIGASQNSFKKNSNVLKYILLLFLILLLPRVLQQKDPEQTIRTNIEIEKEIVNNTLKDQPVHNLCYHTNGIDYFIKKYSVRMPKVDYYITDKTLAKRLKHLPKGEYLYIADFPPNLQQTLGPLFAKKQLLPHRLYQKNDSDLFQPLPLTWINCNFEIINMLTVKDSWRGKIAIVPYAPAAWNNALQITLKKRGYCYLALIPELKMITSPIRKVSFSVYTAQKGIQLSLMNGNRIITTLNCDWTGTKTIEIPTDDLLPNNFILKVQKENTKGTVYLYLDDLKLAF